SPGPVRAGRDLREPSPMPLLEARGLSKRFAEIQAIDQVDIAIQAGEIHVLLGENGAGKSTLMKTLYGAYRADAGQCTIEDIAVTAGATAQARARRVGMVFHKSRLSPALTDLEHMAVALPHQE